MSDFCLTEILPIIPINAGYKDGWTCRHNAVANGNKEAVEIL